MWLGREDSNLRMAESKSAALPLGYAPPAGRVDHTGGSVFNQRLLGTLASPTLGFASGISHPAGHLRMTDPSGQPLDAEGHHSYKTTYPAKSECSAVW